jgi:hypothetical protein
MFFIAVNIKLNCPESVDPDLGSVADPGPGSGAFLTSGYGGSGTDKKIKIWIRD